MKFLLHSRFFFSSAINHREDRPPTVRVLSCLRSFDHTAHGSIGDLGLCPNVQERLSADHLESVPEAVATGSPCEMPETASRLLRKKDIHEFTRNKARRRSSICPISCDFVDCSTPAYRGRNSFSAGLPQVTRSLPLRYRPRAQRRYLVYLLRVTASAS
jgi:hypothetical protein